MAGRANMTLTQSCTGVARTAMTTSARNAIPKALKMARPAALPSMNG